MSCTKIPPNQPTASSQSIRPENQNDSGGISAQKLERKKRHIPPIYCTNKSSRFCNLPSIFSLLLIRRRKAKGRAGRNRRREKLLDIYIFFFYTGWIRFLNTVNKKSSFYRTRSSRRQGNPLIDLFFFVRSVFEFSLWEISLATFYEGIFI